MTESKFKKMVIAITVGAVLLVVILLSIMIYQLIAIAVEKREMKILNSHIAEYNRLIEENADTIDIHKSDLWIQITARRYGLRLPGESELGK